MPSLRSRAWVLLKTITMQNVACPTITVASPSVMPSAEVNVAFRAMPVTMPGNVIGSTTRKLTVLRPKNSYRWTANAAIVPSTSAIAVAPTPTSAEFASDFHIPALCRGVLPPAQREPARRKGERPRRVERVDDDEKQWRVEEYQHHHGPAPDRAASAVGQHQTFSSAPVRRIASRYSTIAANGMIDSAAARGWLLAVTSWP